MNEAIAVVKTAPDNPYGSNEEIAGEILRQIELRKTPGSAEALAEAVREKVKP